MPLEMHCFPLGYSKGSLTCCAPWTRTRDPDYGSPMINQLNQPIYICSIGLFSTQGHVSRKSRKLFRPEKPFVKLRLAYSVRLVFSYVVKRIKTEITSKFRASRLLCFKDTKRIMSPEMRPKSFGTFEKRAQRSDELSVMLSSCIHRSETKVTISWPKTKTLNC